MKRTFLHGMLLVGLTAVVGFPSTATAQEEGNPYASIVDRNPFGLKDPPPPPPPPEPPAPPAPPTPDIRLTGITSLFNQNKALLEITKKGPEADNKPLKLIINEGETMEGVKVVSIDMLKNLVAVEMGSFTTNVTFSVAKKTPAGPPGRAGKAPPGRRPTLPGRATTTTSSLPTGGGPVVVNSRMNNANRGVNVLGGSGTTPPAAAATSRVPTYNAAATARARATSTPNSSANRMRTIPTRTLRTDGQSSGPQMSREEAYMLIEAQRELQKQQLQKSGTAPGPPLPPTPFSQPPAPPGQ